MGMNLSQASDVLTTLWRKPIDKRTNGSFTGHPDVPLEKSVFVGPDHMAFQEGGQGVLKEALLLTTRWLAWSLPSYNTAAMSLETSSFCTKSSLV